MSEAPKMAAQASAKICHDLVEPMGAMLQGLEMLKESGGADPDALQLMESGVMKAWAKLEFYRFAFGGALAEGESQLEEARAIAEKLYGQLKADLKWSANSVSMPKPAVRVIMNLIVIANDCLPRGGVVEISAAGEEVRIVSTGPRAMLKPAVATALRGETDEAAYPGQVIQPFFTSVLASLAGIALSAEASEERVEFIARSKAFKPMSAAA